MINPKIQGIFFSPTKTTFKIINTIADALKFKRLPNIDLTSSLKRKRNNVGNEADIIVFGVPVYSGKIPSVIIPCIKNMKGKNRWAILVTVYGNVNPGNALDEMIYLFREQGFRIIAAASFIGEHSFTSDQLKLAENRPDFDDLRSARKFGTKIAEKLQNSPLEITNKGQKPDLSNLNHERKARDLIKIIRSNEANCTRCMGCWSQCPTDAIDMITLEIKEESCIRCCACIKVCNFGVNEIIFTWTPEIQEKFMSFTDIRNTPQIYL